MEAKTKANRTKCQGCIHVTYDPEYVQKYNPKGWSRTGVPINKRNAFCTLKKISVRAGAWRNCSDEDSDDITQHPSGRIHKQDIKDHHVICEECSKVVNTKYYHEKHPHSWIKLSERDACSCGGRLELIARKESWGGESKYWKCHGCGMTAPEGA